MRMWMVDPKFLCRKHLLGEHGEIHKFRHNFVKQHKMGKRTRLGQIDPYKMEERHNELVIEMISRGYNHNSVYSSPDVSYLTDEVCVDIEQNLKDLCDRCESCKTLILGGENE